MNRLYSRDDEMEDEHEPSGRDREISLGTSFIVGIFFALVLICGIFFAFGYSLGRRSALPASGIPAPTSTTDSYSSPNTTKPAPGSPGTRAASINSSGNSNSKGDEPSSSADEETSAPSNARDHSAAAAPAKTATRPAPLSRAAAASTATQATQVPLPIVQVAAVSRQGDADVLVSALKRRGYTVAIRQVPQDKLLHVQIGPFPSKKDAEAMRQRLLSDGYNAIVK